MTRPLEAMDRPWRLGVSGAGITVGLVSRLLASNGVTELTSTPVAVFAAISCGLTGLGLALTAAQRDSFGRTLWWLAGSTAVAYGTLMWISPPFPDGTDVWDETQQAVLALVGLGVGVLVAGIVTLALVRRVPTMSVALFLISGVVVLAANTLFLFNEWTGIAMMFGAFVLMLLAWDRSPRAEQRFDPPAVAPRTSRAGLSLAVIVLLGTALQLWVSRDDVPRALPAVVVSCALLVPTFWVMYRLRREFQRREMPLNEWTSWMREIRTKELQEELEGFAPHEGRSDDTGFDDFAPAMAGVEAPRHPPPATPVAVTVPDEPDSSPVVLDLDLEDGAPAAPRPGTPDGHVPEELPRVLPRVAEAREEAGVAPAPARAFSSELDSPAGDQPAAAARTGRIADLEVWMGSTTQGTRDQPLYVAIEAMRLDQYDALDAVRQGQVRSGAAHVLAGAPTGADMLVWIDGPYFILAYGSMPNDRLSTLNRQLSALLDTEIADHTYLNGTLAMLRPQTAITTDLLLDQAVEALLRARTAEATALAG